MPSSKHTKNRPRRVTTIATHVLPSTQLAWVAGLLEGEGCFSHKSGAASLRGVTVQCHMTDHDVLVKLHKLVRVGHLRGPYRNGGPTGSTKQYKPRWMWQVSGEPAHQLMKQLLPLMCSRRAARIRELMKGYESVKDHVFKMKHLATGRVETTTDLGAWLKKHSMSNSGLYRTFTGARRACFGWQRIA